jgi:hypothetical protein
MTIRIIINPVCEKIPPVKSFSVMRMKTNNARGSAKKAKHGRKAAEQFKFEAKIKTSSQKNKLKRVNPKGEKRIVPDRKYILLFEKAKQRNDLLVSFESQKIKFGVRHFLHALLY